MDGRRRVLSEANGPPTASVLFVAEAPGRRGGEVTGVPLTRDASGQRFTRLLAQAGLHRQQIFVTNAVLCNPRASDGTNRSPTRTEIVNCRGWLGEQLRLIRAPVVATLGAVALAAVGAIEPHDRSLRAHVGVPVAWGGRLLVPLYHPSPRAGLSRSYADQDEDFRQLGALVRQVCALPSIS